MDNIRFYQYPSRSSQRHRKHAASADPMLTSRPPPDISSAEETGNGHDRDGQADTEGRLQKPAASFVTDTEQNYIVVEDEIGLFQGAPPVPSSPGQVESSPVVEDPTLVQSPLDCSRPRSPDIRCGSDIDESFASPQLPLLHGATIDDHAKEHTNQGFNLEPETQSVHPFSDTQYDDDSAHISAEDAQTQLEHPGSWQSPSCPNLNNDQSSTSTGIPCEEVRGDIDQADQSRSIHESISRGTQVTVPTVGAVWDQKSSGAGHDSRNYEAAGPRDQTHDSASDSHGTGIARAPRVSMAVQIHPDSVPSISNNGMPCGHATDASLPPGSDTISQVRDTYSSSAAMPSESPAPTGPTAGHNLTIYPLEQTDSCILTAVASSLQEIQQLSTSPDAWHIPRTISPSDRFTILGIKPLGDQLWLLLAKVSRLAALGSCSIDSREGADDYHTQTKRKREIVRVVGSDDDSESGEYDMPRRGTKTRRRARRINTSVDVHDRGEPVDPAGGGVSRLKRGNWKEGEDQELSRLVESGVSWSSIVARFPQRSEAAVRSRWYCVLKPLVS